MDTGQESGAAAALARLMVVIRDEGTRGAFVDDPEGVMEREGVNGADIPEPAMQAIKDLGVDELRFVSDICERFTEAGLFFESSGGKVCFF